MNCANCTAMLTADEVKYYAGLCNGCEGGITPTAFRDALLDLVQLKTLKDQRGKTEDYLLLQPLAWQRARKLLLQDGALPGDVLTFGSLWERQQHEH